MEQYLALDPSLPKARAVEAALHQAIATGVLPVNARLPSSRALAAEWGISRNTVTSALDSLVAEGVLDAHPRSGLFVARQSTPPASETAHPQERLTRFDLRPGWPERGSFPASRWIAASRRAASASQPTVDDQGALTLRQQLTHYLARARGVETTPGAILICTGYRTATTILAATLARSHPVRVAVEDPCLPHVPIGWRLAGHHIVDLPVDRDGAQVDELDSSITTAVLTPAHQFPLGGALSAPRRRRLIDWATTADGYVVEDDYDGEFRFDRHPVPALQRSAPTRIIYAGTTSKTLDPGLRLSWLVLPPDLVRPVTDTAMALTGGAPVLNQLALADLISTGDYERHIRRQRREYSRRRNLLQATLSHHGLSAPGISAGLHTLLPHRDPATATRLRERHDIAVHTLNAYCRAADLPPALVLGYATPPRNQITLALNVFGQALSGTGRS